jgi:hypothetical protein
VVDRGQAQVNGARFSPPHGFQKHLIVADSVVAGVWVLQRVAVVRDLGSQIIGVLMYTDAVGATGMSRQRLALERRVVLEQKACQAVGRWRYRVAFPIIRSCSHLLNQLGNRIIGSIV